MNVLKHFYRSKFAIDFFFESYVLFHQKHSKAHKLIYGNDYRCLKNFYATDVYGSYTFSFDHYHLIIYSAHEIVISI